MARSLRSVAALCLWGSLLASVGCAPAAPVEEAAPVEAVVHVARVQERRFAARVEAQGQWRTANDLTVVAPFAATVEAIASQPGDRVRKGEKLGVLLTRESRAALRGAELMLRQASDPAAKLEAQRAMALAQQELLRVPLLAPASGVIARRLAEPGAEVAEGTELLRLVAEHDLVFEAHVPLAEVGGITKGRVARIRMEGGESVTAVVQRRLPLTSISDQTALIWLSPTSAAAPNLLDRFGTASIETGAPRRVRAVPDSAIVADDLTGEMRVACVNAQGVAVWSAVQLGQGSEGWHELLQPTLAIGATVITSGQRGLPDSTRVRWAR